MNPDAELQVEPEAVRVKCEGFIVRANLHEKIPCPEAATVLISPGEDWRRPPTCDACRERVNRFIRGR